MYWQYNVYVISVFIAACITAGLAFYSWRHRSAPGARAFSVLMALAAFLSLVNNLSMLSPSPHAAFFWFRLMFFSLAFMPVFLLIFAVEYTKQMAWLFPKRWIALLVIPTLTQVLVWTNDWHHLFARDFGSFLEIGPYLVSDRSTALLAPGFWVYTVSGYLLTLLAVILIVRVAIRTFRLYRGQAMALLGGVFFPVLGTVLTTFSLGMDFKGNLVSLGFAIGGISFTRALFQFKLFDIIPVARDMLIDNLQDGMLVLDGKNRIVDLNPAIQEHLSLSAAQVIGKPAYEVLQPWKNLTQYLDTPDAVQTGITLTNGELEHYYDLHITLLTDQMGHFKGRLIVLHDITPLKETEKELRQYTSELEASNADLDAFAHTVAHDLKNPLSALVGFSAFMEANFDSIPPTLFRRNLHVITQNGYRMTSIVNELLLLASVRRIEDLDIEPLTMHTIITDALQRLDGMIEEYQAVVITPECWPVAVGYAPWIIEVWVNYISNAIKYGGSPPYVELDATLLTANENGHPPMVRFWVRDNGEGLTGEQQEQLFTQFIRLHKLRAEGHGLGLSIVQRIIHKLGGAVGVESQRGEGSTFYFTLPVGNPKAQ
ncbi:MAG: PAS domain-containing protein [Anaerolineae bacterium]|nr:PAS domain-containing protein [Anaerolineae bacterium]